MRRTEMAKARVLIVDQVQSSLDELTQVLSAAGYQVITVCTACEALKRLDEWGADVVLANLVLPDMSGLELLKRIKEQDGRVGVFLMGVQITPPVILESLTGGAVDLLYKPFVTLSIIRKIEHLLSQSPPLGRRREKRSA